MTADNQIDTDLGIGRGPGELLLLGSLAGAVLRLARPVIDTIDGAAHASVSVVVDGVPTVVATTDEAVEPIGTTIHGPTVVAIRTGRISRVPTVATGAEFPVFVQRCRATGISSAAAFPIVDSDGGTIAALTVTSADHHGFGPADLRAGRAFAARIGAFLHDVASVHPTS